MKFSLFDIMHWPGGTNPTDFDPQRAAEVYDSRMQEYIRAEQLGFDSVFFGEHHFTALFNYSLPEFVDRGSLATYLTHPHRRHD